MATEILMPALSPTMEEGTLAKWLVKEGDTVSAGDLLAEIETDKATMEFEAVEEGVVGKLLIAEGTEGIKVNSPIAIMVEDGEDIPQDIRSSGPDSSHPSGSSSSGTDDEAESSREPVQGKEIASSSAQTASDANRIFATPLARRLAKDRGLDLSQITGSGPRGRIIKSDVQIAENKLASSDPKSVSESQSAADSGKEKMSIPIGMRFSDVQKIYEDREFEEIKLNGMRKTVAARLTEAKQTIPHFYLRKDIRIDTLLKFRSDLNKKLEAHGIKLSVNDFIIKACALALQEVPDANTVWAGDRILRLQSSDVAVAVAVEGGLFTPVLKDAHLKSLSTLSKEMKDLAARARDRKLAPHEYQGGSFAISNLGMFGIDNFDAVINPPHGSILAIGAGVKKPIVGIGGEITSATVMSVTLSVDHRAIDGALGANFLKAIANNLEDPIIMLA